MLEDRAFHREDEESALAEKLSLQEDWFADNLYSESPTNGPVSELLKLAVCVCLAYSISVHTAVRSPSVLELGYLGYECFMDVRWHCACTVVHSSLFFFFF